MAEKKSKKRAIVEISSSSEESESVIEETSSASCTDDDDEDDVSNWNCSENEDEDEDHVDKDDEASTFSKIIQFLHGRVDLQELKLVECKVYLRRHGLRLSGTKEECIERIKEHWRNSFKSLTAPISLNLNSDKSCYSVEKQSVGVCEMPSSRMQVMVGLLWSSIDSAYGLLMCENGLVCECTLMNGTISCLFWEMRCFCHRLKDGNGETFYPRSSFTINCTGDVCKGDVVLFNQRVYESFNKMKRHGSVLGRRTVVGRIVKESYGAAKQQHTFTVEVLWSKGTKKLAPLSPLLVKGRNLYKMKTFRQRWKNERERLNVLAEKHIRGAAARSIKAMRRTKIETKTNKSLAHEGNKRRKHFHNSHPYGTKETNHVNKNLVNELRKTFSRNKKHNPHQNFPPFQELNSKHTRDFRRPTSHLRHQNLKQSNQAREPFFHPNNNYYRDSYIFNPGIAQSRPHHFAINPLHDSRLTSSSESREFNHSNLIYNAYPHFAQVPESRKFDEVLGRMNVHHHPRFYSSPPGTNRWR